MDMPKSKRLRLLRFVAASSARRIADEARRAAGAKPPLPALEVHLADHCNMNCRGCSHFSPIAERRLFDPGDYRRDLRRLQGLFSTVRVVRLLGGEPLLNPRVTEFMTATREIFPKAKITLCTNGILLAKMPEGFWQACRDCSAEIEVSVYPPMEADAPALERLVNGNGLRARVISKKKFHALLNKKGDTEKVRAFRRCRKREYCPMLRDGKIYVCPVPAMAHYLNEKFGVGVPRDGSVDIHTPGISGWDVLSGINEAPTACRYCALGWDVVPAFPWSPSNYALEDWEAPTRKHED